MPINYVSKENLQEFATKLNEKQKTIFAPMAAVGAPLTAETAADMTDETKVYVYTGEEVGYTYGNWYYYDGTGWVSGGIYNATVYETDTTLTESGKPADAKVAGDEIDKLNAVNYTSATSIADTVAQFTSPAAGMDVLDCYTTLPYSATPYATAMSLLHYNGNEASGHTTAGMSLTDEGVPASSAGNRLVGPIYTRPGDTHFYIWWNKDTSQGRTTKAFAYTSEGTPTQLWNGSIASRNVAKSAELPVGTAYVYASTGADAKSIRASFKKETQTFTLPSGFYGGTINYIAATATLMYDAEGNELDSPVVTELGVTFDLETYKGTNDYYLADDSAKHTPIGTTVAVYKEYLQETHDGLVKVGNSVAYVEGTTASRAYARGDMFIRDYELYRVTKAVDAGTAWVDDGTYNSNCVKVNMGDEAFRAKPRTSALIGYTAPENVGQEFASTVGFSNLLTTTVESWMTEYGGDARKIPFILHTDQHGALYRSRAGWFDFISYLVNWDEVSAMFNLGDTVTNGWEDGADMTLEDPFLKNTELESYLDAVRGVPLNKQINVFGNHDTWCFTDTAATVLHGVLPSYKCLNPYFKTNGLRTVRNADNSGLMTIYDDNYHVKYLVLAGWDYTDRSSKNYLYYFINPDHLRWMIAEMSKNDGYDLVLVSHVPLAARSERAINPISGSSASGTMVRIAYGNADLDAVWTARKAKASGSVTINGEEISYDFTGCTDRCLLAMAGHTHADIVDYIKDSSGLLQVAFDRFQTNFSIYFGLIDRANNMLKMRKMYYASSTWTPATWEANF